MDPATPVLVGCGQITQRCDDPRNGDEPLDLIESALRRAAEDAHCPGLLGKASSIRLTQGLWRYSNPAALLGERFGASKPETALGPISGSTIQMMLTDAAQAISRGQHDVVLIAGGEAENSKRKARKLDIELPWEVQTDSKPDLDFASPHEIFLKSEIDAGLRQPATIFSLFENALRAHQGLGIRDHIEGISRLWATFSERAAQNPYAWTQTPRSAEEIRTPTAENRLTAWPYTKFMVSNMVVDQAAALILCSAGTARKLGVPQDRWVYPHSAIDVTWMPHLSHRKNFHSMPAIGHGVRECLALAGLHLDDVDHLDLYSCFPSAVQIAANEIGLSPDRQMTVTGGLGFAGGPFNSYVAHSIATMMDLLRAHPGENGLVTSIGGWMSKHAFGLYSTRPPESPFGHANLNDKMSELPTRALATGPTSDAKMESYGMTYLAGHPIKASIACLRGDGARCWAVSEDPELLKSLTTRELIGCSVKIDDAMNLEVL